MGMVATIINSLALKEALVKIGVNTEVHSLLPSPHIATTYDAKKVNLTLERHRVVILAGGTGKPFFSTDTGAAKDAIELKCKYIVMGKDGVDGVYSGDPKLHKNVIRYKQLTFKEAIDKKLKVMDIAAMQMCQKHNIKIIVFNMERENAIINALVHKIPTTIVSK
jgi:uridylate kinase